MRKNIILDTDAYKLTHHLQYPTNLTKLYSYAESRVGSKYPEVCFFGLQMVIQDHLMQQVDNDMIKEGEEEALATFGTQGYFNREVWEKVRDLGYLPLKIMAVPEGSIVPIDNVLFTMESTEPWFAKTMNALESTLMHSWYPTTVCTRAMNIKRNIKPYFDKSSDATEFVLSFAVNDFGYRGATSHETAARGGAAHLVHFMGSDNMAANRAIKDYYGMVGRLKSVWATEHSVATSFGPGRGEFEYIKHQLLLSEPDKIISIVIDSYDDKNFIQNVVGSEEIKEIIKKRSGRVVFRPDTGDPLVNVYLKSDMLGSIFGFTVNTKGYKVLGHNVGLLQGDGMNEDSIPELYRDYIKTGWAADNFITGSGGGLLQTGIDRDTQRMAIKASYGEKDGVGFNIEKTPASDMTKKSKSGRLKLHPSMNKFSTISSTGIPEHQFDSYLDALEVVYENGIFRRDKFENIMERANKQ